MFSKNCCTPIFCCCCCTWYCQYYYSWDQWRTVWDLRETTFMRLICIFYLPTSWVTEQASLWPEYLCINLYTSEHKIKGGIRLDKWIPWQTPWHPFVKSLEVEMTSVTGLLVWGTSYPFNRGLNGCYLPSDLTYFHASKNFGSTFSHISLPKATRHFSPGLLAILLHCS